MNHCSTKHSQLWKLHPQIISRYKISISTCYLLPFSFWHAFSLFYLILNYFLDFLDFLKHEQTSWFQIMEFIESTYAKLIRALVGARNSWYSLQYCLLDMLIFYSHGWHIWIRFIFIVEISLFPIQMWMLANQVRPFYPTTLKFYECVCSHETWPCLIP